MLLHSKMFALPPMLGQRSQYKCCHKREDKADYSQEIMHLDSHYMYVRNQCKDQGDNEPMLKIHDGDQKGLPPV